MRNKAYYLIASLLVIAFALLFVGSVWLSPGETVKSPILWQVRVPRVLLSALVGVMLAVSGVMLQGILKNPLADPYILGVSSGAGVGAAVAIAANLSFVFLGMSAIPLFAFVSALAMVMIVYNLSKVAERTTPETLILAGVAVSAFASAALALIIIMSGQLQSIYFWLLGSFSAASYREVFTVLPYAVVGILIAYFYSKELN
ncbi:MAG TPA: iron chelate uptake ABC transporter family permease subunit, partial [Candidatus Omnitrophota bacterium]|nr:iron chelate uptake ABC transporter family permease subunit [Candidatus Omnitrophota bacterium]